MATSNGSTAIRDKILASLARYRALRIGKFPCAFWRLSARPGLTALDKNRNKKRGFSGAPCYLTTFWDSCHQYSFAYAANGRCPGRPASVSTTHKTLLR
ncbi:hypothetical protein [Bathymodiolus platifrons methanotrophic gill symbiont]|uniref:hypothetical protein n=1 Tax=Bathymodiolus platifrons methanotrophic gill symbiont TaxID=113268 RepID=UPI001C8D424B|nr:hypothetical protein [Bathymodiolus platifrons methanotrophic gill symbiont]